MKVNQLRGKWLQFKGEVKKQWGTLIDDDLRQIEGNYEKVLGMLQNGTGVTVPLSSGAVRRGKVRTHTMGWDVEFLGQFVSNPPLRIALKQES